MRGRNNDAIHVCKCREVRDVFSIVWPLCRRLVTCIGTLVAQGKIDMDYSMDSSGVK